MGVNLFNLGRVVGLSAYEIYLKQHDSIDPDSNPASEREWLSSSLSMGSSMLVKINKTENKGSKENWILDIPFPDNSILCAASTIIGSFFQGSGRYNEGENWANGVSSYGKCIVNTEETHPSDTNVPYDISDWSDEEKQKISQYFKIIDGIVLQPGNWSNSDTKPPYMNLTPNLSEVPVVRLFISGNIDVDFEILLTGFAIKSVVKGETGLDTSTTTENPQNGDFLGPATFPWANKINFFIPNSYVKYFAQFQYKRQIPKGEESISVTDDSLIDMKTTDPKTFYASDYVRQYFNTDGINSQVNISVDDFYSTTTGSSVITVYQRSEKFPPALWGTVVTDIGYNYLSPLDVVSPGSVKMFQMDDLIDAWKLMKEYRDMFPGTVPMNKLSDGRIITINNNGDIVPLSDLEVKDIEYTNLINEDKKAKFVQIKTGTNIGTALSLSDDLNADNYTISSNEESTKTVGNTSFDVGSMTKLSPSNSEINWAIILEALANDKSIDVLGENLKALKSGLDKNYIQFKNGLRLYISSTPPSDSDIPDGSIGIGWGLKSK